MYGAAMQVSTKDLAEIFRVKPRTVNTWSVNGCPKVSDGVWELYDVIVWWAENLYQPDATEGTDLHAAKLQHMRARAEHETLKVEKLKGSLMSIEEISEAGAWRVSELSNGLSAMALRLPMMLIGRDEIEMREIIRAEMWKLRDAFARTGSWFVAD